MATRRVEWKWPTICAATTLAGMTLGVLYDGPADWAAAILILLPVVVLARKTRLTPKRQGKDGGR